MNVALLCTQILLGTFFIVAGGLQAFQPRLIQDLFPWSRDFRRGYISNIGILELLGGMGLIFPMAFNIGVILTPLAAIGLGVIMILAAITHYRRFEYHLVELASGILFFLLAIVLGRW